MDIIALDTQHAPNNIGKGVANALVPDPLATKMVSVILINNAILRTLIKCR